MTATASDGQAGGATAEQRRTSNDGRSDGRGANERQTTDGPVTMTRADKSVTDDQQTSRMRNRQTSDARVAHDQRP